MSYRVQKGYPIPDDHHRGKKSKYPFDQMGVGDSFFAEEPAVRVRNAAFQYVYRSENKGQRFITREVDEGCRCWRVE